MDQHRDISPQHCDTETLRVQYGVEARLGQEQKPGLTPLQKGHQNCRLCGHEAGHVATTEKPLARELSVSHSSRHSAAGRHRDSRQF